MAERKVTRREFVQRGATALAVTPLAGLTSVQAASPPIQWLDVRRAIALAERRRRELVELLAELVATPSPYGASAAEAQEVVSRYLERTGYQVERWIDDPSRYADHPEYMPPPPPVTGLPVNLVGRPSGPTPARVAVFAHIDTEPPREGWSAPPTKPVVRDGRMYGLGTADDKGGVAAALMAATALTEAGAPVPIVMSLHGKGGGARGSLPAFARRPGVSAALYVHPAETGHGLTEIKHVTRGLLDLTLTVRGWRAEEREIRTPESAPLAEGGDALQKCLAVVQRFRELMPPDAQLNVGRLEAGDRPGTVPDLCHAQIRVLFGGTRTAADVLSRLRRELDSHPQTRTTSPRTFNCSLEPTGMRTNPASVAWDEPACEVLRKAVEMVTGVAPVSYAGHLASDIRFPIRTCGIPAVGIGSRAGNFYGPDEWIDLDDLIRLVAVIMVTISGWASLDQHRAAGGSGC